eukprot:CAMPEP_0197533172 /NCGR_PEP_ID=MMETSP1318-20131121/42523_1 /TAXON_ID=552666 /ORGANISM="Partenskyella glossopodia, Strain RCC365" /LENGTH=596 /DNA_ID=CAMNT_0043089977 /DNA_START=80 /DNA_END=1867 /DNA_ORIENTATION=-
MDESEVRASLQGRGPYPTDAPRMHMQSQSEGKRNPKPRLSKINGKRLGKLRKKSSKLPNLDDVSMSESSAVRPRNRLRLSRIGETRTKAAREGVVSEQPRPVGQLSPLRKPRRVSKREKQQQVRRSSASTANTEADEADTYKASQTKNRSSDARDSYDSNSSKNSATDRGGLVESRRTRRPKREEGKSRDRAGSTGTRTESESQGEADDGEEAMPPMEKVGGGGRPSSKWRREMLRKGDEEMDHRQRRQIGKEENIDPNLGFDELLRGPLREYRRHFEAAGYPDEATVHKIPKRERKALINIVASDMAADGLTMRDGHRRLLDKAAQRLPSPKNYKRKKKKKQVFEGGAENLPITKTKKHKDLEVGEVEERDEEEEKRFLPSALASKEDELQCRMCLDTCQTWALQRWTYSFVLMSLFLTVSMLIWAAEQHFEDADAEARDPALKGAWSFALVVVYICWGMSAICFLSCVSAVVMDPSVFALLACVFTCQCDVSEMPEIDTCHFDDCDCLDSFTGCREPGGLCYRDPYADPCCDCTPDPDIKPCCWRDPDAPPPCCAEESLWCPRDPDVPACSCCVDPEGVHCCSKIGDSCDTSRW